MAPGESSLGKEGGHGSKTQRAGQKLSSLSRPLTFASGLSFTSFSREQPAWVRFFTLRLLELDVRHRIQSTKFTDAVPHLPLVPTVEEIIWKSHCSSSIMLRQMVMMVASCKGRSQKR
jgi:hypothetical protein